MVGESIKRRFGNIQGCGLCEAWKSYDYLFQFFDEIVLGVETNEPKRNGKSIK